MKGRGVKNVHKTGHGITLKHNSSLASGIKSSWYLSLSFVERACDVLKRKALAIIVQEV
jgi:hypothetical protein